jgi:hypothetical protein
MLKDVPILTFIPKKLIINNIGSYCGLIGTNGA